MSGSSASASSPSLASLPPWTKQLWIYDLLTNQNFTLKTRQL
jgi:hypothetical protein